VGWKGVLVVLHGPSFKSGSSCSHGKTLFSPYFFLQLPICIHPFDPGRGMSHTTSFVFSPSYALSKRQRIAHVRERQQQALGYTTGLLSSST